MLLSSSDPDAPSRTNPVKREWRHWVVVNLESADDLDSGTTLTSYNGPAPPARTGTVVWVEKLSGFNSVCRS